VAGGFAARALATNAEEGDVHVKVGRTALALVTALAIVTSCGGDVESDEAGASSPDAAEDYEPVTVTDCNETESRFEAPPERVVPLTYPVLEMLFWLGVEDRVIGTGTPPEPGQLPEEFDAEAQDVPKLSGEYEAGAYQPVPREILIGNDPDFVVGGFSTNFDSEQGAASQEDLDERGIRSYLAFSLSCSSALTGPQEDLSLTHRDLENLGAVMGVPDRAEELVDEMEATVDGVQEQLGDLADDERPTVFVFEAEEMAEGDQSPYAAGNRQTVNAVIELAGGRNAFGDLDTDYERVGWESVIERDPDVMLIVTYAKGDDAADEAAGQDAEEFLTTDERTRNMPAVQEGRFVHLLYEEASAGGVRNAEAVEKLAAQLHPDLVEGAPGS
jgi:iron complex transport system substrate-binding protein